MAVMEIGAIAMLSGAGNPFQLIADYGLRTAQLQNWDMDLYTKDMARKVQDDLKESGVYLAAFWGGYTGRIVWDAVTGPETCGLVPRDLRRLRLENLKRGAEFAAEIGAPALVTHVGFIPENPHDALYQETLNAVYEIASYCGKLGLEFWFETGQETPVAMLRTIEDLGLKNLGVNLDPANLITYGRGNPVDAVEILAPYLKNLHIKDGLYPVSGRSDGVEVPVGKGKVDFDRIIRKLSEQKFTGELIVECEIGDSRQEHNILEAVRIIRSLREKYLPETEKGRV